MLLSTHTEFISQKSGIFKTVEKLKNAGFDAYDLSFFDMPFETSAFHKDDYKENAKKLRKFADELGIKCNQSHAPFPSHSADENWNKLVFEYEKRSLEVAAIAGASICVVHPCNDYSAEENAEKIYLPLLKYSEDFGIKIGVENMWNWNDLPYPDGRATKAACSSPDDFVKHLKLLPEKNYAACLDIGHAEMFREYNAADYVYALGGRLEALHVHDNDCFRDLHYFPYMGTIDFERIFKALAETGYGGDLTFEANYTLKRYPESMQDELIKLLHDTGRVMIDKINGYKK